MKNTLSFIVLISSFFVGDINAKQVHHSYVVGKESKKLKMHQGESGKKASKNVPLSDNQQSILKMAYNTGKQDGLRQPEILPAIIMQESKAGTAERFRTAKHKKAYDKTVGLGQIKVEAARHVMKKYPDIERQFKVKGKDLEHELGYNDKFNIAIASKYLLLLDGDKNHSADWLIAAYNRGGNNIPDKPWKLEYVKNVRKYITVLHL